MQCAQQATWSLLERYDWDTAFGSNRAVCIAFVCQKLMLD